MTDPRALYCVQDPHPPNYSFGGGVECTVARLGDIYRDQVAETGHRERHGDLDLIAALGIRTLRYPVLWETISPFGTDACDWSWHDMRFAKLQALGITPIVGLMHHGSGPRATNLLDPAMPALLATHAARVAERTPFVQHYTPINEPLTTGALVLEQADSVGATWRRHYDRLHLHTDRDHSGLPGLPMPKTYPRYPSREQVLAYLEGCAAHFGIRPVFGSCVDRIERENDGWRVAAGAKTYHTRTVVIATGIAGEPLRPPWAKTEVMHGEIIHSSAYRNPTPYSGKRVLVVGFGNSGGEIALDLAEAGVEVALSVRGPVQVIPRDLLGLPILTWVIAFNRLPARVADAITAPILRLACGSIERIGLVRASKGPRRMVEEDGRVPLIDIGTLAAIRSGAIKVFGAVERLQAHGVTFVDGTDESFDTIILATGFGCDLKAMLPGAGHLLDHHGTPRETGVPTGDAGLYFCGQIATVTGQLRTIALEAEHIALLAR